MEYKNYLSLYNCQFLLKILKSFEEICSEKRGEIKAEIKSAKQLSETEINKITEELSNNFKLEVLNYKRIDPKYKNLQYKYILKKLNSYDATKVDILLVYKKKILETCTSNLLLIRNNKYYSPKNNCYIGNTINYLSKKVKINFKDINLKDLHKFDEILLIGSGKGVTPVKFIKQYKWKNKSMACFKKIKKNFKLPY